MTFPDLDPAERSERDDAFGAGSSRFNSKPGTRAKVLLAIAMILLAFSLGLEERFASRFLASPQVTLAEDRYLEDVRLMLRLAHAGPADAPHPR